MAPKYDIICGVKGQEENVMATAIKATPTLRGREAREFLRNAEKVERNCYVPANKDEHPFCKMAHAILTKSGMLK